MTEWHRVCIGSKAQSRAEPQSQITFGKFQKYQMINLFCPWLQCAHLMLLNQLKPLVCRLWRPHHIETMQKIQVNLYLGCLPLKFSASFTLLIGINTVSSTLVLHPGFTLSSPQTSWPGSWCKSLRPLFLFHPLFRYIPALPLSLLGFSPDAEALFGHICCRLGSVELR